MKFQEVAKHVFIFFSLLVMFLVILPLFVSMSDWEPVILGIILTIMTIVASIYWVMHLINRIDKLWKEKT